MGRHARGVVRSRVPLATVLLAVAIVTVVAAGSWFAVASPSEPDASSTTPDAAPLGIAVAGLLALAAVGAVALDRRRSRNRTESVDVPGVATGLAVAGRHARVDAADIDIAVETVDSAPILTLLDDPAQRPAPWRAPAAASGTTVDLVFPFASNLAASLRDELFTHRSLPT